MRNAKTNNANLYCNFYPRLKTYCSVEWGNAPPPLISPMGYIGWSPTPLKVQRHLIQLTLEYVLILTHRFLHVFAEKMKKLVQVPQLGYLVVKYYPKYLLITWLNENFGFARVLLHHQYVTTVLD